MKRGQLIEDSVGKSESLLENTHTVKMNTRTHRHKAFWKAHWKKIIAGFVTSCLGITFLIIFILVMKAFYGGGGGGGKDDE